ncbi:hypothetical protein J7T55_002370 [Diaporthe amygdali]|uniref:uncharacterized protein n=1 Tax=Phomopsis amygdali TaxID=1214568 RepID=UPI0022FE7122|nr:uncharacterized protein J7T55_002370 [Diaporthe amygdali]KAJ0121861.1 hypothetical protein J7T55_002370 [Diaporthe amygdali]
MCETLLEDGAPSGPPTIVSRIVTAECWQHQRLLYFKSPDILLSLLNARLQCIVCLKWTTSPLQSSNLVESGELCGVVHPNLQTAFVFSRNIIAGDDVQEIEKAQPDEAKKGAEDAQGEVEMLLNKDSGHGLRPYLTISSALEWKVRPAAFFAHQPEALGATNGTKKSFALRILSGLYKHLLPLDPKQSENT